MRLNGKLITFRIGLITVIMIVSMSPPKRYVQIPPVILTPLIMIGKRKRAPL